MQAKSSIELYQEAYNLHFREGRPDLAKDLYRQIMEQYPDSNERKYAQFLLARTSAATDTSPEKPSNSVPVLGILGLVIGLLGLGAIGGLLLLVRQEQRASLYNEKILLALNGIQSQNEDEALLFLREAKMLQPRRVAAYSLSSQIHLQKQRFDLAEAEYKLLLSMDQDNIYAQTQLTRIARKRRTAESKLAQQKRELQKRVKEKKGSIPGRPSKRPQEPKPEPELLNNQDVRYF